MSPALQELLPKQGQVSLPAGQLPFPAFELLEHEPQSPAIATKTR